MTDRSVSFPRASQIGVNALYSIAQADRQHRLAGVLQQVDDTACRILQKDVLPVCQQVIFRSRAHGFDQPLAEFALQKANNATNFLQRESAFAQLTDDRDFGEVVEQIDAFVAVASRNHYAVLVPPLKLTQADACELCYPARCEGWLQCSNASKQNFWEMFETS